MDSFVKAQNDVKHLMNNFKHEGQEVEVKGHTCKVTVPYRVAVLSLTMSPAMDIKGVHQFYPCKCAVSTCMRFFFFFKNDMRLIYLLCVKVTL